MIYLGILVILLAGNILIPAGICAIWPRDGDVGCWFCCGVLLTQLSGGIVFLKWSRFSWERRFVLGAATSLAIILSAWISFRIPYPVGPRDNAAMLRLTVGFASLLLVGDLVWWWRCRWHMTLNSLDQGCRSNEPMKFSLSTMLVSTTFCACLAALARYGHTTTEADIRDIRSYEAFPFGYLAMLALYLWGLHTLLMAMVLAEPPPATRPAGEMIGGDTSRRTRLGQGVLVVITGVVAIGGLEALRRMQELLTHASLDYLNWEFAMVTLGFIVGHLVAAYFLRWRGYRIERSPLSHPQ